MTIDSLRLSEYDNLTNSRLCHSEGRYFKFPLIKFGLCINVNKYLQ